MLGTSKSISGFDPRTVPSCQLWLDAADPTGTGVVPAHGSSVSTWVDKSGYANSPTSSSGTYPTYNSSLKCVTWAGGASQLTFPATIANAVVGKAFTIFFVEQRTTGSSDNFIIRGATQGIANKNLLIGALNSTSYRWGFYANDLDSSVSSYVSGEPARISCYIYSKPNRAIYLNGSISANSSDTNSSDLSSWTGAMIGGNAAWNPYYGNVQEMIIYASSLTLTNRQQVEGYLAHKWGLVQSSPTTPLSIPGLALWLDGADQSSMTLSGSSVIQWNDKSGNGYVMTNNQGTTSISTASLNSLSTVYTPSGTNSKITNFVGRTKCTIFLVGKAAISRYLLALNGGFLYTANDSLLYFSPPTGNYLDLVDSVSGSIVSNNTWFILCIGYDNATNSTANPYTINGTTRSTTITPRGTPGILTDQNITSTLYINSTNGTNSYDSVYTAEILYYNDTLTTFQRQIIETYLAKKWGIGASTIVSTHPFSKNPPYLRNFQPIDVPGCQLWLDAFDQGSLTFSDSTITQWNDRSGNMRNASYAGSPSLAQSVINGRQSVYFNGSSYFTGAISGANTTTLTVFLIGRLIEPFVGFSGLLCLGNSGYEFDYDNDASVPITMYNDQYAIYAARNSSSQRTEIKAGVPFMYVVQYDGTYINTWLNGTQQTPVNIAKSGTFDYTQYTIASRSASLTGAYLWSGYFGEILVYNTALTTTQRQQVEGYLAHKWGFIGPSPTTPLLFSGCQLWLDGADPAGTGVLPANGATVSTWVDKSGNGKNATGVSSPTYNSSTNRITMNGSSYFTLPNSTIPVGNSLYTIFFVVSTNLGGYQGILTSGIQSPNAGIGLFFYPNGQIEHGWYTNNFTAPPSTVTANTLGIISAGYTASLRDLYFNGTLVATNNPGTTNSGATTPNYLGRDITGTQVLNGTIAEVLIFNTALPTAQRQQVEGYLAKKWGIDTTSASIPSIHPFSRLQPAILPFSPRSISGLAVWLDAADQSSMTLSGSSVIQWSDKSGNNRHATQSVSVNRPVYSSSDMSVDTTTNPRFFNMTNMPSAPYDIFVVGTPIATTSNWRTLFRTNTNDPGMNPILLEAGSKRVGYFTSTGFVPFGSYTWEPSTRNLLFARMNSTKTMNASLNGQLALTANTAAGTASDVILYMGALVAGGSVFQEWGTINEVIFYTTPLTTAQRQQVEGYLAHKWGLAGASSTPLSIPGCQLWLDAADSSTVTGTTTVTQWRDKSGNARHLSAGSGTTSYSSNAIQVNNSYLYVESPVDLSKFTVFVVAKTTGGNNQTVFSGRPNPANNDEDWDSVDGFAFFMDYQSSIRFYGQYNSVSSFSVNTSTPQVFSFQSSGTSLSAWYNGISQSGATLSSTRTTTAQGFIVGGSWSGSSYYNVVANASVYEAITYNTILTTSQRQTIESYLANKWGIETSSSSFPSSHPYLKVPPA